MPHQNTTSPTAAAQNAATDPVQPDDRAHAGHAEPRSYAAADLEHASLAPPAAGEIADAMDEGDALEGESVQQGGSHADRPRRTETQADQGARTVAAHGTP